MRLHAFDAQLLHFHQRARRDIGHEKNVADAVAMNGFGQQLGAGHRWHAFAPGINRGQASIARGFAYCHFRNTRHKLTVGFLAAAAVMAAARPWR